MHRREHLIGGTHGIMDALSRLPHLDVIVVTPPQSLLQPSSSAHLRTPTQLRNRCGVLTWNTSGLTSAALAEALQWAEPQQVQILVFTETRWQGSRMWSQNGWHCISSSGHPHRSCGLVTCIKSSFCTSDQIGWTELMAGRLMHIRIFLPSRAHARTSPCFWHDSTSMDSNTRLHPVKYWISG